MRILIFEDEQLTAQRLIQLIRRCDPAIEILAILESVKNGLQWLETNPWPELIFMDIQLSDGLCFELFEQIALDVPVIFTTAYDEYAIKAFKVNSIDYLVKPIDFKELKTAIDKFRKLTQPAQNDQKELYQLISRQLVPNHKRRFLIKIGDRYQSILAEDIAYFYSEHGNITAVIDQQELPLDYSLDQLEQMLDPRQFFRLNRKYITNFSAIRKIHRYFHSRLKIELAPAAKTEVLVSREKVDKFKEWLNG